MALPWPLPAFAAWALSWAVFLGGMRAMGWSPVASLALGACVGLAASRWARTRWRRVFVAAGFPLSAAAWAFGAAFTPSLWLLPLALLALVYPMRTWRDAPVFPTPRGALRGLAARVPLGEGARVLDAGCGLGDALVELHREYPHARLEGIEWSWPLRFACARRAPFARVRRGDLWAGDWSAYALVYVFQRPETMDAIGRKAATQMSPGAWLVSLEFEVPGRAADVAWTVEGGRQVFAYRMARPRVAPGLRDEHS